MDPSTPSSQPPSSPPPGAPPAGFLANINPKVRNLAIGLLVAALAVLIGTFSSSWASHSEKRGEVGVGLRGLEGCERSQCASIDWDDIGVGGDYTALGWLGTLGGLAAVAGAVAIGVFALTNKPNKVPAKYFNIVLGVTAFAMMTMLIRILTEDKLKRLDLSISYGGIVAIGGLIAISVVARMLGQARGGA